MAWKIVIVEDEDLLRNGMIRMIPWEKLGFEIAGDADNGVRGLELVKFLHPDAVFSDIRMAQMDGLTMAEQIHAWDPEIYIIFISGYDEFDYARKALQIGSMEYILKPVRLEEVEKVLLRLAALLEQREQERDKLNRLEKNTLKREEQDLYSRIIFGTESFEHSAKKAGREEENGTFYCVLIAEWGNFPLVSMNADYMKLMEMDHMFERELTETLQDAEYTMIKGNACDRILIVCGESVGGALGKRDRLERLLKAAKGEIPFWISTGNAHSMEKGIRSSYLEACEAMQKRLKREWGQENDREYKNQNLNFINFDKTSLVRAMVSGDKESIQEEFSRLEKDVGKQKELSHMHLILIVSSIFESIAHFMTEKTERTPAEVTGQLMGRFQQIVSRETKKEILDELLRYCLEIGEYFEEFENGNFTSTLKRAVNYMESHYAENLLLSDVAKHAYISSSYLSMILKKETGKTFIENLTDIRMKHAKKLLEETPMKNYEVAETCGFANATYFSTVFKSVFGCSPSTWRKEHASGGQA